MNIKRLNEKQKLIVKVIMMINLILVLGLGIYYFVNYIINTGEDNFFHSYVFLPLFIALLATLIIEMSTISNNSSFRSNSSADKAMFYLGIALLIVAVCTIFIEIFLNSLKG